MLGFFINIRHNEYGDERRWNRKKKRHQIEIVCMDELMSEVHLLDELSSVI